MKRRLIVWISFLGLLFGSNEAPAWALNFFELEVYPYDTAQPGELEVESLNSYVINGQRNAGPGQIASEHLWRSSLEMTYGLTDHLEAAGYLDFARTANGDFDYGGARFHGRYRILEKDQIPVNLSLYAEVEVPNRRFGEDNNVELELRLIFEKDMGPLTVQLNPIFEKSMSGNGANVGTEFHYAAKGFYRWRPWLMPGIEFFGDVGPVDHFDPSPDQKHIIGPVLDIKFARFLKLNTGFLFGLTRGSDSTLVKLNVEYEFEF